MSRYKESDMKRVLVIQNDPLAPAGYFGLSLLEAGAELTTLRIYQAEERLSVDVNDYQALLVLGGRINAFDEKEQGLTGYAVQLISAFHQQDKAIFGICLGAQLIAKTLNTGFRSNDGWEVGFTDVRRAKAAEVDPIFSHLPEQCRVFEMHEDSFFLPQNSELLMSGKSCTNQAFRVGRATYGVQFHPEATESIVGSWVELIRSKPNGEGNEMANNMLKMQATDFQQQNLICQTLANHWLSLT